ncbi:50S ribosomal protein L4, partial [Candidatus Pacearchaeota archaeon]|nr:50S ribosomal protein L4 [Candidatus Pacearchaeota archaeon]
KMKTQILDIKGESKGDIELPSCFNEPVREDLILKVYLATLKNTKHRYAPYLWAGMQHSASGKIRHQRRKWKTAYGYGISRVPRKIMTKRGSRFFWVGATISSARGGREAHPPKVNINETKINKKEMKKALYSAISATSSSQVIKKKYHVDVRVPIIFDSEILKLKTKEIMKLLKGIFKTDKKILFIIGEKEKMKSKIIEITTAKKLNILQLATGGHPGRLVVYTEHAIKELGDLEIK